MRCAHWLVGACMAAAAAASNSSDLRSDHPEQYTVVRGDTLWDISARFLQSPWLWPEIWQANPSIQNPHLIYPGDQVRLVYVQGQPRLVIDRNGVVKLSPRARVEPLAGAIPTLPYNVIAPYLNGNQFVAAGELEAAPYVVGQRDGKILSADGDVAYVKGEAVFGLDRYGVYRKGRSFFDPTTGELLGVEAVEVGHADVHSRDVGFTRVSLDQASREIRPGDRLLPRPPEETADFVPSSPPAQARGEILSVIDGVEQVGQYDVVVLNLGREQAIQAGNVMAIYREGQTLADPVTGQPIQLPDERSGLAMVFRVFDRLSYALILEASRAMTLGDSARSP